MEGAREGGAPPTLRDLYDAVMEGAVERVRPKMMTVTAIMAGLLPILVGQRHGRERDEADRGADGGRDGQQHGAHAARDSGDLLAVEGRFAP